MKPLTEAQIAQLERLHKLRETGALNEAEFRAQKQHLLDDAVGATKHRRPRALLVVAGAAALILASAVGLGLWASRDVARKNDNANLAETNIASDEIPPPAAPAELPLDPKERLALASYAAIGTRGAQTKIVDGEEITTTPLRILELPFGPVLLTKREIKDGCHACTGDIGAYYLEQTGREIVVKARYPEAVKGWGWGAAPKFSITDNFTRHPAIYSEGGGGGQGYFCSGSTLVELTPSGPVESDLINTGYSDSGAIVDNERPAREIEGKIVRIQKGKSFDVVAKGSEKFVEHYVFKNGKFVRTVTESKMQC